MAMQQILLIEDEPLIRDSLEDVLNLEGYGLTTAHNGQAGLQAVQQRLPDLIICDINMPEMDGYRVLESLRADPKTRNVPFVFLTARSSRADQRQGMDLGADDFLTKPFTVDELMRTVKARLVRTEVMQEQYNAEFYRNQTLQQKVRDKEDLATLKAKLLDKVIEEFRTPLSNVNMALSMLERAQGDEERQRYINILRHEYSRQVGLLNEVSNLQEMSSPRKGGYAPKLNVTNSKFL